MERQEYTAKTYPSFGKKYNGEKAIISLTSWRARINTVSKTIYSLIKQCTGFHIVLVLSEEEFPKMMDELPENLKIFADNELIEVLWVYKNYKAFKKVLFTMDKYRDVPIISADDDCIYTCNYAQELYSIWEQHKDCCVSPFNEKLYKNMQHHQGCCTLYSPNCFSGLSLNLPEDILNTNEDDILYTVYLSKTKFNKVILYKGKQLFTFHDSLEPLEQFWRGKTLKNFEIVEKALS